MVLVIHRDPGLTMCTECLGILASSRCSKTAQPSIIVIIVHTSQSVIKRLRLIWPACLKQEAIVVAPKLTQVCTLTSFYSLELKLTRNLCSDKSNRLESYSHS